MVPTYLLSCNNIDASSFDLCASAPYKRNMTSPFHFFVSTSVKILNKRFLSIVDVVDDDVEKNCILCFSFEEDDCQSNNNSIRRSEQCGQMLEVISSPNLPICCPKSNLISFNLSHIHTGAFTAVSCCVSGMQKIVNIIWNELTNCVKRTTTLRRDVFQN